MLRDVRFDNVILRRYIAFHWMASGYMEQAELGCWRNILHFRCLLKDKCYGDNNFQNFRLGTYDVAYTVGKLNFQPYIWRYTSRNDTFEYGCPLSGLHMYLSYLVKLCNHVYG